MDRQRMRAALALTVLFVATVSRAWAAAADSDPLRLTLPPTFYAVVGQPMRVYFDNIVLTPKPESYQFAVGCKLGTSETRCWTVEPQAGDVGQHPWEIVVTDRQRKRVAAGRCMLHVAPADAGQDRQVRLLIVGDSLTNATAYPNEIGRLLGQPGNPRWTMIGTNRPASALPGVGHEGYGGWTWARFATHYAPPTDDIKKRGSPFVVQADGKPVLDVAQYFQAHAEGTPPDMITFLLGINDCFRTNPEDPAAVDARIKAMFEQADVLVAAFHQAAPKAALGICLTTPPNARQSGFDANYKGIYSRWQWKQMQHELVRRELAHFGNRQQENIFIVPTELNIDPVEGFPENNGVHPNPVGYKQIGGSLYAWIKWRMEAGR